jgi:hypothetical protein
MALTPIARPSNSGFTKQARNQSTTSGQYNVGRFGVARYGSADGWGNQKARPSNSGWTKKERPST